MLAAVIRHPFLTLGAALALACAGLWAWRGIPVDAIPDLSDNQVIVWAEWPGQSPEDVERQVTSRLTRELQGLPGIVTVRGLSLYGAGYVYLIFEEKRELYACRNRVLERLGQLGNLLPPGVAPRLGPDATAMGQVYAFTLQGPRDVEQRRRVLDHLVTPALRGVPGVAEVAPAGGVAREFQVDFDPGRLAARGLTAEDLWVALQGAGRDTGLMSVERGGVETMLRGAGFLRTEREIADLVVRADLGTGASLRLGDVARVTLGGQVRQGVLADAEQENVGAIVALRVGADPRTVIGDVKRRLHELAPALAAEQLAVRPFYDRTPLIRETTATLTGTLVEAVVTTVVVVVAFLLHARASLAVAVSLPLGMLFTFLVMAATGVGANIMSLAGIAIAIGVMVDFGIIVTENITQHLADLQGRCRQEGRAMPTSPFDPEVTAAVIDGAREVARPLLTAAATTVIGFLPVFALQDQAGRLFEPLALTKSLAISGAVLAGVLVVPVLCRLLLPPWQVRRPVLLAVAGLAGGAAGGWFLRDGWRLPLEHGRWAVTVPGWLFGPVFGGLVAALVWRLGRERLVNYEENPASRAIHTAYEWAYARLQRHRGAFTAGLLALAGSGYLTGLGWPVLRIPLDRAFTAAGADLAATTLDRTLTRWFPGVGSSFLPPLDEGSLLFMPSLPAAAGLGETQRVMLAQNRQITAIPEVAGVMGKLGRAETALDPAPLGMIETVVVLKPYAEWPRHEFTRPDGTRELRPRTLAEVRGALAAASDLPGVAPSWLQPIETRVVMLSTGIRSLLALQVLGEDGEALERFAAQAEALIAGVPGATDVQVQREGGKPYAELRLDPARLARAGITREAALRAAEAALGGLPGAIIVDGALRYPVRVRQDRERRDDPDELADARVPLPGGRGSVPLAHLLSAPEILTLSTPDPSALLRALPLARQRAFTPLDGGRAELVVPAGENPDLPVGIPVTILGRRPDPTGFTSVVGPMAIRSEGGRRTQYVMLNVSGRGEVDVVRDADARLRSALAEGRLALPPGATYRWVGRYEQKLKADEALRGIIAVSFGVMILLIYAGTRSWLITTIIIVCNAGVTTAGGFFLVWLWGAEMTTAVAIGFLVLLGVMFNDGILLGTYLQEQFRTPPRDAAEVRRRVLLAGLRRRRPAVMTNATTLLSLIPVLWSTGRGAELMQPMVLPVVGGMIFDLVSLFSVPLYFSWYWERRLARAAPVSANHSTPAP